MQELTESKLKEIVRAVLRLAPNADVRTARQLTEPAWDSLATALLAAAIASEFGLEIDAADSMTLTSFDAIAAYLEERGL